MRFNRRFIFVSDSPIPNKGTLKKMKVKFNGKIVPWEAFRFMNRYDLTDASLYMELGIDVVGIWIDLNDKPARRWLENVLMLQGHLYNNCWVIAIAKDIEAKWCDSIEAHIKLRHKEFALWNPTLIDGKLKEHIHIYAPQKWYHKLATCLLNFLVKRSEKA